MATVILNQNNLLSDILGVKASSLNIENNQKSLISQYINLRVNNSSLINSKQNEEKDIEQEMYIRDNKSLFNLIDKIQPIKIKFTSQAESICHEFLNRYQERVITNTVNYSDDYMDIFKQKAEFNNDKKLVGLNNKEEKEVIVVKQIKSQQERLKKQENKERYYDKKDIERQERNKVKKVLKAEQIQKESVKILNKNKDQSDMYNGYVENSFYKSTKEETKIIKSAKYNQNLNSQQQIRYDPYNSNYNNFYPNYQNAEYADYADYNQYGAYNNFNGYNNFNNINNEKKSKRKK